LDGVTGRLASETGVTGLLDSNLAEVRGLSALAALAGRAALVSFLISTALASIADLSGVFGRRFSSLDGLVIVSPVLLDLRFNS